MFKIFKGTSVFGWSCAVPRVRRGRGAWPPPQDRAGSNLEIFKDSEKVLKLFKGFERSHFEKCSNFRKVFEVLKIFKGALWYTRERTRSYVHVPPGEHALVSTRRAAVGRGQCFCITLLRAIA